MELIEVFEDRRREFDDIVGGHIWGDVLQGWAWGEVQTRFGWQAHRFVLQAFGRPVGAVSLLHRELPFFGEILYAPRGPVLDPTKRALWKELARLLRIRFPRAFTFICEPRLEEEDKRPTGFLRGRRRGPFQGIEPRVVAEIPLSGDSGRDFGRLHRKCRYHVRLAARRGITARVGAGPDRATFLRLLQITARRVGFNMRPPRFYAALMQAFSDRGQGALLLAGRGEEDYAAAFVATLGRHAVHLYGASDGAGRRDMAAYACQWAAISWAAAQGAERFDMSAISPRPGGGLRRFKMRWGAVERRYIGPLDAPLRWPQYLLYRFAEPVLSRLPRWRGRLVTHPAG